MDQSTLLKHIDQFRSLGSGIACVQPRGYRSARWTYRQVFELACQFARELEARGIGKGDHVLIWGDNQAEWVAAFLGCVMRGAVAVPMDLIAAPDFAQRVYAQVGGKLWVCSRDKAAFAPVRPVVLDDLPGLLSHHDRERYPPAAISAVDTVEIVFTSGTTAEPRGVVISHKNVLANLAPIEHEIQKYLRYEKIFHPLRFMILLPLSHVFGQFMGIFVPPLIGATVVFQDTLNPLEIIRKTRLERVSAIVTVPRLLESLRSKVERDRESEGAAEEFRARLESAQGEHFLRRWWRFRRIHREFGWKFWAFVSGGAALDAATEQFWNRLGFAVIQGYGLTETTSLISVNHPFKLGKGSLGKVLPGREIKLDGSGEILVRGGGIAAGYYRGHEVSPVAGEEGWFHTGDLGEVAPDGSLYFRGRKKDVIVTAEGMKVFPEDLEAALRQQPEVRDCVVMNMARGGNAEPLAVLLLRNPQDDPEPIVKRANESLAGYQHIRHWTVWPEEDLPRTSTQKPKMAVIREAVMARLEGTAPTPPVSGSLAELIASVTGNRADLLLSDTRLSSDLNLNSVDRVELQSALEDRFQVCLDESAFTAATTIRDLENLLRRPPQPHPVHAYPRWSQRWPVAALRLIAWYVMISPVTHIMAYPRVRGRHNLKGLKGPLLLVCNHITEVDACFILAALPARFRHRLAISMRGELLLSMRRPANDLGYLRRLEERISYWLVTALFNVFPLPQESGYRQSFAFAGETADRGYSILVFPEGQRTREGTLAPFRAGVGVLAKNLGLPLVPIRIDGLFELKMKNKRFARPGNVVVSIGRPLPVDPGDDPNRIATELRRRIIALDVRLARTPPEQTS